MALSSSDPLMHVAASAAGPAVDLSLAPAHLAAFRRPSSVVQPSLLTPLCPRPSPPLLHLNVAGRFAERLVASSGKDSHGNAVVVDTLGGQRESRIKTAHQGENEQIHGRQHEHEPRSIRMVG